MKKERNTKTEIDLRYSTLVLLLRWSPYTPVKRRYRKQTERCMQLFCGNLTHSQRVEKYTAEKMVCYALLADTLKYITCLGGVVLTVPPLLSGRRNIEEYFNVLNYDGAVLTRESVTAACGWGGWYTSVYFLSTSIVFSNLCGFYITQKGENWQWYIAHCNNWSRGSVSTFFQFLVYTLQKSRKLKMKVASQEIYKRFPASMHQG